MAKQQTTPRRTPTNITIQAELKAAARKLAAQKRMSLSELIERLLVAEIKRKRGIAHLHHREVLA